MIRLGRFGAWTLRGHWSRNAHPTRLFVGLIGLGLMNGLSLNIVPLMNGTLIGALGLSTAQTGMLISEQILLGSLAAIWLSARMHLLAPRLAGVVANLGLATGMLAFAFARSLAALYAASAIAGIAMGILGACSAAAIAGACRVDRTAALVSVAVTGFVALLTFPLAAAAQSGGRQALFVLVAVIVGLSTVPILILPSRKASRADDQKSPPFNLILSPIVLSSICLQVGSTAVWAFTERIGADLGISTMGVGEILAGSTLLAILGGVAAAVISRPGRERAWAIAGVMIFGLSTAAVAVAGNALLFTGAMYVQAFFFVFCSPFITAVAMSLDRSGGLATAAGGWSTLTAAGAPSIAGWLVRSGHYGNLAVLALAATVLSVGALAYAGRSPGRSFRSNGWFFSDPKK